MRKLFLGVIFIACVWMAAGQTRDVVLDSGKLVMFKSGKIAGSETFSIKSGEASESASELNLDGTAIKFTTLTEYTGLQAKSFQLVQEPNTKLQFTIRGAEVQVTGSQQASGKTEAGALILENLVWHHYSFLLKRYDAAKGGLQHFTAFVPSVMATIPTTLEKKESAITLEGLPAKLDHYVATFQLTLRIDIWAESDGKLAYIRIPAQAWEAVNEKYAERIDSIRKDIAEAQKKISAVPLDYSAPADAQFVAEEVTVPAKGYTLGGTLLLPKQGAKPFPAIITISGSGQQTRDEPIPIPGLEKYRPFRQIGEALAGQGIAVLRVDDRGVGKSGGREGITAATTFDFADDTRAQVAYLRTRPEINPDRIALIGHSEGGLIAPLVASTDPRIAAIVLMAGGGKTGEKVIMDQTGFALEANRGMDKTKKEEALQAQQQLLKLAMEGTNPAALPEQMRLPWYREFLKYDPLPTIRKVRQPILILQGALDQQVTPEQAPMIERAAREAGNQDVTLKVFPNLNHLFLPAKTGAVGEYSSLQATSFGQDLLDSITGWLQKRLVPGK